MFIKQFNVFSFKIPGELDNESVGVENIIQFVYNCLCLFDSNHLTAIYVLFVP